MKQFALLLSLVCLVGLMSCSPGDTSQSEHQATPSVTADGETVIPEESIEAAKDVIRNEFAKDANFVEDECTAYDTNVPGRYRVEGRFYSVDKGYSALVFGMYIQKFSTGWEYGHFMIQDSYTGKHLIQKNGEMKAKEANDGVGESISAGGVDFKIAERKPTAIRIYTKDKLNRSQLKAAILDLKGRYETIQFATEAKHARGEDYASWTANMFFDYDTNEIINQLKFFE